MSGTIPEDERARFIDGLRVLADALEEHPEVPLPYHGTSAEISFYFLLTENPRAEMAAAARALPCSWQKEASDSRETLSLHGQLGALRVELVAYRNDVCTRVVTGTEDRPVEVVVTPAVTETVVKPVEIVRWECSPILAPALADKAPMAVAS
jgi:hypothetical protein